MQMVFLLLLMYFGGISDGALFRKSTIHQLLKCDRLNIPIATPLADDRKNKAFPYYLVSSETFSSLPYLIRRYLNRRRKIVECAFGMLTSKFRVFENPITCNDKFSIKIIEAACALLNFNRTREGKINEHCSHVVHMQSENNNNTSHVGRISDKLHNYL